MGWLWQDLKFGARTLLRDRVFLVTAVLALALGIGSTTAIFSVIDNVLLEPFPYTDGQRLVAVAIHDTSRPDPFGRQGYAQPEFLDYQEQNTVFSAVIGVSQQQAIWTDNGHIEAFRAASVTGNTFEFLGVAPLIGRAAAPHDAEPGAPPVFVLSYKVWQKRFAGDPNILGRTFTLDSTPRTLIGIMPKRFAWWGADLWIPKPPNRAETGQYETFVNLLGRLKPGLTSKSAALALNILAHRLAKTYPKYYPDKFDVQLPTIIDNVVGQFRSTLYTLLAAVGFLLLIACANVANLLLAKATAREKEFAIRASLGAGSWRVIGQLLVESLLLALLSAAAGCAFAYACLKGLVALLPAFTFPDEADISLNLRVLAATVAVSVLTALIFGLAPAVSGLILNLSESLKAGGRGNSGFRRGWVRNALIVGEVALSLVLLTGAGLLMRSFLLTRNADLGLNAQRLVVSQINLDPKNYKSADKQTRFLREATARLAALPGVVTASSALDFPPFGGIGTDFEISGETHGAQWKGQMGFIDSQFFPAVGLRLLRGRAIDETDVATKRRVAVVNDAFVRKFLPNGDPIGKQVKLSRLEKDAPEPVKDPWFEIVGVCSDIKNHGVRADTEPEAYAPLSIAMFGQFMFYLRTAGDPAPLTKALDSTILAMDHTVYPQQTATMERSLDENEYAQPRFGLEIFSLFAGIGLVLVAVGVYSVISYTVSQQNREIGIRLALGAPRGTIFRFVMVGGLRYILIGVALGSVVAFFATRLLKSQLAGLSTTDPPTLAAVVALLVTVGIAACSRPAFKATRVDPLVSLRDQ
ncbi:MAG TPA: ABC transporter permease [Bryobacteraceae bacterium]|nr:ABC transporter permease [Bryobacteraceae bacterium]